MLDYCWPSLLAAGNLPGWPYLETSQIHIYTTPEDRLHIESHFMTEEITKLLPIKWFNVPDSENQNKYNKMDQIHNLAIQHAHTNQQALLFFAPDAVFSAQSLSQVAREIKAGKELIAIFGSHLQFEDVKTKLNALFKNKALVMNGDQGATLFSKYMTSHTRRSFIGHQNFVSYPAQIFYWTSPSEIEARCFHLHPFFIRTPHLLKDTGDRLNATIDGDYINHFIKNPDKISVITDNRLFAINLNLDSESYSSINITNPSLQQTQIILDVFKRTNCLAIHEYFFQHKIKIKLEQPQTQYLPVSNLNFLTILDVFWKLENSYFSKKWTDVIKIYNQYSNLLLNHLESGPFASSFYFIAVAFYELNQWFSLKQLIIIIQQKTELLSLFFPSIYQAENLSKKDKDSVDSIELGGHSFAKKVSGQNETFYRQNELLDTELLSLITQSSVIILQTPDKEYRALIFYAIILQKKIIFNF